MSPERVPLAVYPWFVSTFVAVTDSTIAVAGFRTLASSDLELVAIAPDETACLDALASHASDLVVIDAAVAADAAGICRAVVRATATPVLILAVTLNDVDLLAAIEAGARGYLYKDASISVLIDAMQALAAGQGFLDTRVTTRVIDWAMPGHVASAPREEPLSAREIEVLRHVATGASNKQIARRMDVSENTIKMFLRRAYRKLGCETRAEATAEALRRGWA